MGGGVRPLHAPCAWHTGRGLNPPAQMSTPSSTAQVTHRRPCGEPKVSMTVPLAPCGESLTVQSADLLVDGRGGGFRPAGLPENELVARSQRLQQLSVGEKCRRRRVRLEI